MRKIDLNDLPEWSKWPARMLEFFPWKIPRRTTEKIDQEYDKDKYKSCLEYFTQAGGEISAEEIKQFELDDIPDEACISLDNELYVLSSKEAIKKYYDFIPASVNPEVENCETIFELGCGYGYNLWLLNKYHGSKSFIGGDYSRNAVQLASSLYCDNSNLKVLQFDFFNEQTYLFLESTESPVLIFTVHAIEQLPDSSIVFDTLLKYRDKIKTVIHLEPAFQLHDKKLIGLMQKRYAEINDYNTDLISQLEKRSYISVLSIKPDMIGVNPLNPTSVIKWQFTD